MERRRKNAGLPRSGLRVGTFDVVGASRTFDIRGAARVVRPHDAALRAFGVEDAERVRGVDRQELAFLDGSQGEEATPGAHGALPDSAGVEGQRVTRREDGALHEVSDRDPAGLGERGDRLVALHRRPERG